MKNTLPLVSCCVGSLAALSVCQAAPFQNLGFESATTNNLSDASGSGDYYGPMNELIPGWQVFSGSMPYPPNGSVGFNLWLAGTGYTTIVSPSYIRQFPVIGLYSFAMIPNDSGFVPFSLSQSGDLPSDVKSIHFLSYGSPLLLEVNGSPLSLFYTPTATQPSWDPSVPVFDVVGDNSSFAGETVELKFTTAQSPLGYSGLDEIYFSTIGVPEPSTLVLFSLGGLALLVRRFRQE